MPRSAERFSQVGLETTQVRMVRSLNRTDVARQPAQLHPIEPWKSKKAFIWEKMDYQASG